MCTLEDGAKEMSKGGTSKKEENSKRLDLKFKAFASKCNRGTSARSFEILGSMISMTAVLLKQ